jgi:hypothetical protein
MICACGVSAFSLSTMDWLITRLTLLSPLMLLST